MASRPLHPPALAGAATPEAREALRQRLAARRARDGMVADAMLFVVCTAVVVASMVLSPSPQAVSLFGVEIPGLCMWRNLTGTGCFGCGMTRSFTYMGHLDVAQAWELHRLGPPLYALVAAQVPWRAFKLGGRLRTRLRGTEDQT